MRQTACLGFLTALLLLLIIPSPLFSQEEEGSGLEWQFGAGLGVSADFYAATLLNNGDARVLRNETSAALILQGGFKWALMYVGLENFLFGNQMIETSLASQNEGIQDYINMEFLTGIIGLYPLGKLGGWQLAPAAGLEYSLTFTRRSFGFTVIDPEVWPMDLLITLGGQARHSLGQESPWLYTLTFLGGYNLLPAREDGMTETREEGEIRFRLITGISRKF